MEKQDNAAFKKPENLIYVKDATPPRYELKNPRGNRKLEIAQAGEHHLIIFDNISDLKLKEGLAPRLSMANINELIGIGIMDKSGEKLLAVAFAEGETSRYSLEDHKVKDGKAAVFMILHKDGSINELSDDKKIIVRIENKDKGKYIVLNGEDANTINKEVVMGMGSTKGAGKILSEIETPKFPVADASEGKEKIPTAFAGQTGKYKSLS